MIGICFELFTGQRSVPRKNRASMPGPTWATENIHVGGWKKESLVHVHTLFTFMRYDYVICFIIEIKEYKKVWVQYLQNRIIS